MIVSAARAASILGLDRRRVYDFPAMGAPVAQTSPLRFHMPSLLDWYIRRQNNGRLPTELEFARSELARSKAELASGKSKRPPRRKTITKGKKS